ncbi:type IV secretory system conjugative DNA transfer family protein [Ahrensia marina]|uniref:Uncharacterized protein n=1 Tax=Ahrensia marina TaxID=1514904 RepID=A0A0M9GL09_9HYPH|nr:type IV secretory system conjugative DNA transfer family protein [Ahrensia marina]KPA99928.1 hypothetical protein SU32_16495 [Ahrensia marina]
MTQIVSQIVDVAVPVVSTVMIGKVALTVTRWSVIATAKKFGAWDPRWNEKIPRLFFWRPLWRCFIAYKEWCEEHFGLGEPNAGLLKTRTQLCMQFKEGDSLMGRVRLPLGLPCPDLTGEPIETHKVIIGPAASGKSVTEATQLGLMSSTATAAIYDPKGQHTHNILYALADQGHKLVVIDPLSTLPRASGKLELFANIRELNRRMDGCFDTILLDKFAAAIFPEDGSPNKFFVLTPRQLWTRVMAYAMSLDTEATVLDARRLLTHGLGDETDTDPKKRMLMLWFGMARSKHLNGYVAEAGIAMIDADEKTRSNVLMTTRTRTEFWSHEQIQAVSDGNDAFISDLKPNAGIVPGNDEGLIISFVIPVGLATTTFKPYLAQWFAMMFFMFEAIPGDHSPKARLVIEELQSFGGSIDGIDAVAPLLRGYGCSFTAITQDIHGLEKALGEKPANSLIASSSHVQFVATNDTKTRGMIQNLALGEETRTKRKLGFLWKLYTYTRPVFTNDQLRRVLSPKRKHILVHRAGGRAALVKQAPGYSELPVWLHYPDRDHGETPARAWFRSIYESYTKPVLTIEAEQVNEGEYDIPSEPEELPDPQPQYVFTREDALALFGLTEPFSSKEVAARAKCMNDNFPPEMILAAVETLGGAK